MKKSQVQKGLFIFHKMQNKQPLILNTAVSEKLDLIGDRWVLLILRDLFMGRTRFETLRVNTGASKATLSRRLDALIQSGIVIREETKPDTKRFDYVLTESGKALFGASMLAWKWESNWFEALEGELPRTLVHKPCNEVLVPKVVCQHCNQTLKYADVLWPSDDNALESQMAVIRSSNNQRRVRTSSVKPADIRMAHVSDLIGDRWTLLLLIAAFLGVKRNDGFSQHLNIASNILSQRLAMLVDAGIFNKALYQNNPNRYEYLLTDKAKSLFPLIMILRQWAITQEGVNEPLRHKSCDSPLSLSVVCGNCNTEVKPADVEVGKI